MADVLGPEKAEEPRSPVDAVTPITAVIPPTPTTLEQNEPFVRESTEPYHPASPYDPPSPAKTEDPIDGEDRPPKRAGTGKSKIVALDSDVSGSESESDVEQAYLSVYKEDSTTKQEQVMRRAVASVRYAARLESRVSALEKELRNIRGEDKPVSKRAKSFQPPVHEVASRYLGWDEFKPKPAPVLPNETGFHNFRPDPTPGSVLEILVEEPGKVRAQTSKQNPNEHVQISDEPEGAVEMDFHSPPPGWLKSGRPPPRLRIRSKPLLTVLKSVTNSNWALRHGKLVFLRPYKTFVTNEQKIREAFRNLEAKYERPKTPIDRTDVFEAKFDGSPAVKRTSPGGPETNVVGDDDDETIDSQTAYEHMKLFMQFMDQDLKSILDLRGRIQEGSLETIAFDDLWHLFQIGQEVVAAGQEQGSLAIYRVLTYTGGRELTYSVVDPPKNPPSNSLGPGNWYGAFAVQCWSLTFDGEVYIPQGKTFGIQRYEGERKVTDLAVYPLHFDSKRAALRNQLEGRGRVFMDVASKKTTHRRYAGPNLDEDARGEQINSEVIIDFKEAFEQKEDWEPIKLNPDLDLIDHDNREWAEMYSDNRFCRYANCCTGDPVENDFSVDLANERNFLRPNKHLFEPRKEIDGDEDAILLPDRVYAYLLVTRKWAIISTSEKNLQSPTAYDPWDDLVLPADHKETVEALVRQHLAREEAVNGGRGADSTFGDFISSKGRGLVFLLHGPPGIGKTSTVECITARVGKPLYSLTSGNLGTSPEKVEDNLRWHFSLADKWGCVLLLDEADVFLQRRVANQININAIVSVFLRQLEYYNGILFLTTNRVGDIDAGFKSRIHVTLEYKPLDLDTTMQIYQNRLDRVVRGFEGRKTKSGSKPKVKTNEILDWAEQHYIASSEKRRQWNGRSVLSIHDSPFAPRFRPLRPPDLQHLHSQCGISR
ncbi:hypothetical protein P152DRAFT_51751 [Eremomyces bilateralis CBS 781.70]|uniref:AAA+ ATPase domain-containing protein n=1 Tax=Eremomyces bilateralis CBS 781.70 TaxID=1392243 RepID=A0A6G1G1W7_9PEZI|nr:uncharacterized protein P152DRAFT_51751 [Eremomyces bilateralis CBS 781.70]KAF1811799.1 hypothetical protein P152DRAFT_51751 [Eremomyces bilateralis CBS 781.70]